MTDFEKFKYNYMMMCDGNYDQVEHYLRMGDYILTLDYTTIRLQLKSESCTRNITYDASLFNYNLYCIMDIMKLLGNRLADKNINDIKMEVKGNVNREAD